MYRNALLNLLNSYLFYVNAMRVGIFALNELLPLHVVHAVTFARVFRDYFLLVAYRSSFLYERRCAAWKWMVLHFRRDEAGPKIFTGYVASIVKRYKGRREDEVRRRTQVARDEDRDKDGDEWSSVVCLLKRTWPSPFCLSASSALLTLIPFFFSRVYKHEFARYVICRMTKISQMKMRGRQAWLVLWRDKKDCHLKGLLSLWDTIWRFSFLYRYCRQHKANNQ